ncbi:hypothetical protein ACJJTC_014462 [Scirpophaga incertulas]
MATVWVKVDDIMRHSTSLTHRRFKECACAYSCCCDRRHLTFVQFLIENYNAYTAQLVALIDPSSSGYDIFTGVQGLDDSPAGRHLHPCMWGVETIGPIKDLLFDKMGNSVDNFALVSGAKLTTTENLQLLSTRRCVVVEWRFKAGRQTTLKRSPFNVSSSALVGAWRRHSCTRRAVTSPPAARSRTVSNTRQ